MDIFLLYLFTRVDTLNGMFFFVAVVGSVIIAVASVEAYSSESEPAQIFVKKWRWVPIVAALLLVATPRQKDLAIIVGGHFAIEAAQSDTAKKIYAIVTDTLDEKLAEIAKKRAK